MTLTETYNAAKTPNAAFLARVSGACLVIAQRVGLEAPSEAGHAERVSWATRVFANIDAESLRMAAAVVAHFTELASATVVFALSDDKIQQAVRHCVGSFSYSN